MILDNNQLVFRFIDKKVYSEINYLFDSTKSQVDNILDYWYRLIERGYKIQVLKIEYAKSSITIHYKVLDGFFCCSELKHIQTSQVKEVKTLCF